MRRTARRLAAVIVAVGGLLALTFAGAVVTRRIALVSTFGVSMNPVYYQGDLVVVQRETSYGTGEIVAYHRPDKHLVVLHRIIGGGPNGYVFKGDNNQSIDPTKPTQSQLIGRAVLHIPGGGRWFRRATSPGVLGGLVFLLLGAGGTAVQTRRSRRRKQQMSKHSAPSVRLAQLTPTLQAAAVVTAVLGVAGLSLAAAGWSGPTTTSGPAKGSDSTATFSYHARVPRSAAYDSTVVRSPDPVFRRLAQSVDVHLAYSGAPGTVAIRAEVSSASGWHTTLRLSRPVDVPGPTYQTDVALDLPALDSRARAAATASGFPAGPLQVAVVADITRPSNGPAFTPRMQFELTPLRLALVDRSALVFNATSEQGRVVTTPRQLHLLGATTAVRAVRTLSLLLLAAAGLAGLATLLLASKGNAASESERIQRRYAGMLLSVQPMPMTAGRPVVDVAEFGALVRLAERYGLLILHWTRSDVATYLVQDDGTTYRYRPGGAEAPLAIPGLQPCEPTLSPH